MSFFKKATLWVMIASHLNWISFNVFAQYRLDTWEKDGFYELRYNPVLKGLEGRFHSSVAAVDGSFHAFESLFDGKGLDDVSYAYDENTHTLELSGDLKSSQAFQLVGDYGLVLNNFSAQRSFFDVASIQVVGKTSLMESVLSSQEDILIEEGARLEAQGLQVMGDLVNHGIFSLRDRSQVDFHGYHFRNHQTVELLGEAHLSLLDLFENHGEIRGESLLKINSQEFDNQGTLSLGSADFFAGGGFVNQGELLTQDHLMLSVAGNFMNYLGAHMRGGSQDIKVLGDIENYGTLEAEHLLHLKGRQMINGQHTAVEEDPLTGEEKEKTFKGRVKAGALELDLSKDLDNQGSIVVDSDMKGKTKNIQNQGEMRAPHFELETHILTNEEGAKLEGNGSIKALYGWNKGFMGGNDFSLRVGNKELQSTYDGNLWEREYDFINESLLRLKTLTGTGSLLNRGTVYVDKEQEASKKSAAAFSIRTLLNQGKEAFIVGNKLTFTHTVDSFHNEGGTIEAETFRLEDIYGSKTGEAFMNEGVVSVSGELMFGRAVHNKGTIRTQTMIQEGDFTNHLGADLDIYGNFDLNKAHFINQGEVFVQGASNGNGLRSLQNSGSLVLGGRVSWGQKGLVFTNKGTFHARDTFNIEGADINSTGIFIADKGVLAQSIYNGFLKDSKSASLKKHYGEMVLKGTLSAATVLNAGKLILEDITFARTGLNLRNYKSLVMKGGTVSHASELYNSGEVRFMKGLSSSGHNAFLSVSNVKEGRLFFEEGRYDFGQLDQESLLQFGTPDHEINKAFIEVGAKKEAKIEEKEVHLSAKQMTFEPKSVIRSTKELSVKGIKDLGGTFEGTKIRYVPTQQEISPLDLVYFAPTEVLSIHGADFIIPDGELNFSYPLELFLSGDLRVEGSLTADHFKGRIQGGLYGSKTNRLSKLFSNGTLYLDVGSWQAPFIQVYGETGAGVLVQKSSFSLGAVGVGLEEGPYIASNGKTSVQTRQGSLTLNAQLYGKEAVDLKSPQGSMFLNGGQVLTEGDIFVQGKRLELNRVARGGGCSHPALLTALGSIYIQDADTIVRASDIVASGSVYLNGQEVASKDTEFKNQFQVLTDSKFPGELGRVIAGDRLYGNAGQYVQTGFMHAPKIRFRLESWHASTPHSYSASQRRETTIEVDLIQALQGLLTGGITRQEAGQIVPVFPIQAAHIPTNDELVFWHQQMHLPKIQVSSFMVHPAVIDILAPAFLAHLTGKSRIEAQNSQSLVAYLSGNAREWRQENGPIYKEEDRQELQRAMLVYKGAEDDRLSPLMAVPSSVVNPHQGPGNTSGVQIDVRTKKDMKHQNTFIAATPSETEEAEVTLHAHGNLIRETTRQRKTRYSGRTRIIEETGAPQRQTIVSAGNIKVTADQDYQETGADSIAKGDLTYGSTQPGQKSFSQPLILKTDLLRTWKTKRWGKVKNHSHHQVRHTQHPSRHIAGQDLRPQNIQEIGTQNHVGRDMHVEGAYEAKASVTHDEEHTHKESGGFMGGTKQDVHIKTPNVQRPVLSAQRNIHFHEGAKVNVSGATISAKRVVNESKDAKFGADTAEQSVRMEQSQTNLFGTNGMIHSEGQEILIPTRFNVDEFITQHPVLFESVEMDWEKVVIHGEILQTIKKLKIWKETEMYASGMGEAGLAIFGIAVGILTYGAGSSLATTLGLEAGGTSAVMCAAGFSSICTQLSTSFVANGGDIDGALKSTFSSQGLRNLAISVASAGLCKELFQSAGVNKKPELLKTPDYFVRGGIRLGVNTTLKATIGGERIGDAFKGAATAAFVNTVGEALAYEIGQAYGGKDADPKVQTKDGEATPSKPEKLSWFEHKGAHALLGAVLGAVQSPRDMGKGALSGAIGGALSEVIAEQLTPAGDIIKKKINARLKERREELGRPFLTEAEYSHYMDQVERELLEETYQDVHLKSLLATAFVSALGKQDITITHGAASNALDNNFAYFLTVAYAKASKEAAKEYIARLINGIGWGVEEGKRRYGILRKNYPEEVKSFERGAYYAGKAVQYAGEALLVGTSCTVGSTFTFGAACVGAVTLVAANHTGVTESFMTIAAESTGELLGNIEGVNPLYARNAASVFFAGVSLWGGAKVYGNLGPAVPLASQSYQTPLKLFDIRRSLSSLESRGSSTWESNPFLRGVLIEEKAGHNLLKNFEKVDRKGLPLLEKLPFRGFFLEKIPGLKNIWLHKDTVYSIKTLDLRAATYQNPSRLYNQLKNYIDDIAGKDFFGQYESSRLKLGRDYNKIGLDLRIPYRPKGFQKDMLEKIRKYAESKNVVYLQKVER